MEAILSSNFYFILVICFVFSFSFSFLLLFFISHFSLFSPRYLYLLFRIYSYAVFFFIYSSHTVVIAMNFGSEAKPCSVFQNFVID